MKLIRNLLACALTLIFFNTVFLSYSYADNVMIESNGTQSTNTAAISSSQTTTISEQNTSQVTNTVNTTANTGNNMETNNTQENTSLTTGDASSNTNVATGGNMNMANVSSPQSTGTSLSISGNGSGSTNTIASAQNTTTSLSQTNSGSIQENAVSNNISGENSIGNNTGTSSIVTTGDVSSQTDIKTAENRNVVSAPSFSNGENITLTIKKNGSNSLNTISINVPTSIKILSNNALNSFNFAYCNGNSGNNNVSRNVGSAKLLTGMVSCHEHVENVVNVNTLKLPQQEICQNIPPVIPSSQSSSSSSQSQPSSGSTTSSSPSSSSSGPSTSSSGVSLLASSSPSSPTVLGVSVLPSTGFDLWKSVLFYAVLGILGFALRCLPQRKFSIHVLLR